MNSLARNSDEKSEIKAKIIGLLEQNGIPYNLFGCNGNEKLCIGFGSEQPCCNNCCNFGLTILP